MDIKNRIEKLGKCFVSFNVMAEEAAAYAVVRFPKEWSLPDKAAMKENFKVEIAVMDGGFCFITEISNGTDCIFDAIDYVIDFNKELEIRKTLLQEKINELKNLFVTEPVEKIKTLRFTFEEAKKPRKTAPKKKVADVKEETEETVPVEEPENVAQEENKPEDGGLMSFAKKMVK